MEVCVNLSLLYSSFKQYFLLNLASIFGFAKTYLFDCVHKRIYTRMRSYSSSCVSCCTWTIHEVFGFSIRLEKPTTVVLTAWLTDWADRRSYSRARHCHLCNQAKLSTRPQLYVQWTFRLIDSSRERAIQGSSQLSSKWVCMYVCIWVYEICVLHPFVVIQLAFLAHWSDEGSDLNTVIES